MGWMEKRVARCHLYGILALCFYEPTAKLIHYLISNNLVDDFRQYFEVLDIEGIENDLNAMKGFDQDHQKNDPDSIWRLCNAEYMRLFVGPGCPPCPPYESVYRADVPVERRGLLMGDAAVEVLKKYVKAGLNIAPDHNDLPDHISTELEFMYFLCKEELAAWETGDYEKWKKWLIMQEEFLTEHLNVWVPSFSKEVEKASNDRFYLGAVSLCRTHIRQDVRVTSRINGMIKQCLR